MSKKGYVIPHTHWDREWRYALWESRVNLANMMDELIGILENQEEYKCFLLDGQFVPIKDYLFLRPENEARLKKLVADGRIRIGPWYTLPDLYPVSGESIVRNLLRGRKECEAFGGILSVGYESFGWGQPSQFPQIYKGFGIDTVIVAKKVDSSRAKNCEFAWVGKDGTTVLATRLGQEARANFFMHSYMRIMSGKEYKSDEFRFDYDAGDLVYHTADIPEYEQDYHRITDSQKIHTENLREIALKSWHAMDETLLPDDRAMMDGSDHTYAQPKIVEVLRHINKAVEEDGIVFAMSDIEEYAALLKEKLPLDTLPKVYGELRDGPPQGVTGNALMTRPMLKRKNRKVQNALMDTAEPLAVAGMLTGQAYPSIYLDTAMDYLLLSHSHDCINGVTQDKTVNDVMYRLDQAGEIADVVTQESVKHILKNIDGGAFGKSDALLLVVNPLPFPRREIVEAYVDLPREEDIWSFDILDADGNSMNVQQLARDERVIPVVSLTSRPEPFYVDRHRVQFESGLLPSGGYKVFRVVKKSTLPRKTEAWAPSRKTLGKEIAVSPLRLENEFLRADILGDGSVRLLDKKMGQEYGPLNYFEDTGDVGDYWIYYPPYQNKTFTTKGMTAELALEENTELQATVTAKLKWELPAFADRPRNYVRGRSARSEQTDIETLYVRYTLRKGENMLRVHTELDNKISDHRMAVQFETGVSPQKADAQGHFCVDRRDVLPLRDEDGRWYNEMTTQPMQDFVSVAENGRGFAVVTDCLSEYDASKPGLLSCTLMRGMKNILCTEFRSFSEYNTQDGGQSHGRLTYDYALLPHAGETLPLMETAKRFNIPAKTIQFTACTKTGGTLPAEQSFYSVEGASVSAIKKAEHSENIVIRLFNADEKAHEARIRLIQPVRKAYRTDLAEQRSGEAEVRGGAVVVEIGANKIVTLELEV